MGFYQELTKEYHEGMSKKAINKLKSKIAKKYALDKLPRDSDIMLASGKTIKSKTVRTLSGVAPIAVMTKPIACKHGRCIFCPGGPSSYFGDVPQSYTGKEPSTMRAIRNNYDPYLIVFNRLEQYICLGQLPEKVELIIQGGTFCSFPKEYQEYVIKYCFKALNDFSALFYTNNQFNIERFKEFFELPSDIYSEERIARVKEKILSIKDECILENEQDKNETANIRCVGLTIETKPDWAKLNEGNEMLRLGCTRIELGLQSLFDEVLLFNHRGHNLADSIESLQILKDLGFKINAHYMLGLPSSTKEMDLEGFKTMFEDSRFCPDMLKIYPCLVIKGTPLYLMWKKGKYHAVETKEAAEIIAEGKKYIPEYCRIMRIQRDIPTYVTSSGVDRTNLRQYVGQELKKRGIKCRCIRCRESGRASIIKNPELKIIEYGSSGGKEFFISFVDENDTLIGFCRMRFPSQFLREEITQDSALIRELHVFSSAVSIGKTPENKEMQHRGFGKILLKKAEEIAKSNGKNKIVVISGVGVRQYYYKQGYHKENPYVVKYI